MDAISQASYSEEAQDGQESGEIEVIKEILYGGGPLEEEDLESSGADAGERAGSEQPEQHLEQVQHELNSILHPPEQLEGHEDHDTDTDLDQYDLSSPSAVRKTQKLLSK